LIKAYSLNLGELLALSSLEDHLFGDRNTRLALALLGQEDMSIPLHVELLDVILYLPLDLLQVL